MIALSPSTNLIINHPLDTSQPYPETADVVQITETSAVSACTAGQVQQIRFCFSQASPATALRSHPAVAEVVEEVYECSSGHRPNKRWWQEAGVTITVDVPRCLIQLLPECGYSYTKLSIVGHEVVLNVSGGTAGPALAVHGITWCDWIHDAPTTLMNHPPETLQAVLDAVEDHRQLEKKPRAI